MKKQGFIIMGLGMYEGDGSLHTTIREGEYWFVFQGGKIVEAYDTGWILGTNSDKKGIFGMIISTRRVELNDIKKRNIWGRDETENIL